MHILHFIGWIMLVLALLLSLVLNPVSIVMSDACVAAEHFTLNPTVRRDFFSFFFRYVSLHRSLLSSFDATNVLTYYLTSFSLNPSDSTHFDSPMDTSICSGGSTPPARRLRTLP